MFAKIELLFLKTKHIFLNDFFITVNFQWQWRINLWSGIMGDRIIGPHIFNGNLNSIKYRDFLRDNLPRLTDNNPIERDRRWFMHDGAGSHNADIVSDELDR